MLLLIIPILGALLFVAALCLKLLVRSRRGSQIPEGKGASRAPQPGHELAGHYQRKDALLSPAERLFYRELKSALSQEHEVSCKVRLEDIFQVKPLHNRNELHSLRIRIKSRHVDFVVTKADDSQIVALVELDDATHRSKSAQASDRFKDELARSTGLSLLRFPARSQYAASDIQQSLYGLN